MRFPTSPFVRGLAVAALVLSTQAQADTVKARCEIIVRGETKPTYAGPCTFSQRQGAVSIELTENGRRYEFTPVGDKPGNYVDDRNRPVYRKSGLGDKGQIYEMPTDSIRVYWDTALADKPAGRPAETAAESGKQGAKPVGKAYDNSLELHGISFHIQCTADGKLTITPKGLKGDNSVIKLDVDGAVKLAEVADLNVDQSPEVYIVIQSSTDPARTTLVAYSANRKKSLSAITLPEIPADSKDLKGYRGYDDFAPVEGTLVRRFPLYTTGNNPKPTGKWRQFQYKLKQGEAGWILRVDKVLEY